MASVYAMDSFLNKYGLVMKKIIALSLMALGTAAWAQQGYDYYEDDSYLDYQDDMGFSDVITAKVIDVKPITETISVPERREMCERIPPEERRRHKSHGGAILGGIIGGVLGNQVGKGNGRKAATAAGLVIGSAIGNKNDERRAHAPGPDTRCYLETVYREEEQLAGYDVSYRYNGEVRHARLRQHPGSEIQLRVDVSVIE